MLKSGLVDVHDYMITAYMITYMITAISVITRTGYNEQIRLDLGARYMRFPVYLILPEKASDNSRKAK